MFNGDQQLFSIERVEATGTGGEKGDWQLLRTQSLLWATGSANFLVAGRVIGLKTSSQHSSFNKFDSRWSVRWTSLVTERHSTLRCSERRIVV